MTTISLATAPTVLPAPVQETLDYLADIFDHKLQLNVKRHEILVNKKGLISQPKPGEIDSIFLRDVVAATPVGLIKCNMSKKSRLFEPERWFVYNEVYTCLGLGLEQKFEGADLHWITPTRALLAIGKRTNKDGANHICRFLNHWGVIVKLVRLPDWHDQHLLGLVNSIGERIFVAEQFVIDFVRQTGLSVTPLPQEEVKIKGPNWVCVRSQTNDRFVICNKKAKGTIKVIQNHAIPIPVDIGPLLEHGGGIGCATAVLSTVGT